jgi:hypothetical protein
MTENLEKEANVDIAARLSIDSVMKVCNGILHFERRGELWLDRDGPSPIPDQSQTFTFFMHAWTSLQKVPSNPFQ